MNEVSKAKIQLLKTQKENLLKKVEVLNEQISNIDSKIKRIEEFELKQVSDKMKSKKKSNSTANQTIEDSSIFGN